MSWTAIACIAALLILGTLGWLAIWAYAFGVAVAGITTDRDGL